MSQSLLKQIARTEEQLELAADWESKLRRAAKREPEGKLKTDMTIQADNFGLIADARMRTLETLKDQLTIEQALERKHSIERLRSRPAVTFLGIEIVNDNRAQITAA